MAYIKGLLYHILIHFGIHLYLYSNIIQLVNGLPPTFKREAFKTYNLDGETVNENKKKDDYVGTIEAYDPDGSEMTGFSIAPDSQGYEYFNVIQIGSSDIADVTLKKEVDFESSIKEISIEWILKDADGEESNGVTNPSLNNVKVAVGNVNDEPPIFDLSVYNTHIPEDEDCGNSILTLSATDADEGNFNDISFEILSDDENLFIIDSQNCDDGICVGAIQLSTNCDLDYEKQQLYIFNVIAKNIDNPTLNDTSIVYVYVDDAQDMPPEFTTFIYTVDIKESNKIDTSIINVTAIDGDKGVDSPNTILYTIDSNNYYFKIDNITGEIKIKNQIELDDNGDAIENNGIMPIEVMAYEDEDPHQNTTTTVTIIVTDVDDNEPIFSNSSYYGKVSENEIEGVIVISSIRVTDIDLQYPNNNFKLFLNQPEEVFDINPSEGIKEVFASITVKDNKFLDYEESYRIFNFQICAQSNDYDKISCTNATIEVLDKNDHTPNFINESSVDCNSQVSMVTEYNIKIKENYDIDEEILTVQACDEDSNEEFFPIIYRLEGTTDHFTIGNLTGIIMLTQSLDFETAQTHILNVVAADSNGRVDAGETTVRLTIVVTNVNDIAPRFLQNNYIASMLECDPSYEQMNLELECDLNVVQVYATDEEGDSVIYEITGGRPEEIVDNFVIDYENGTISLKPGGSVDYEIDTEVYLEVIAKNFNSSLYSQAEIKILVEGQNDNSPQFNTTENFASVQEYPDVNLVNNTVLIVDVDDFDRQYLNGGLNESPYIYQREFDCRIQSGSLDHFSIISTHTMSGCEIKVVEKFLDRDINSMYNLSIIAIDRGNPPLTGSSKVYVTVDDVNNKSPYFLEEYISVDISEGSEINDIVLQLNASDPDHNPNLHYSIKSIFAINNNGDEINKNVTQQFDISHSLGNIYVNELLDRELIPQYSLKVQVLDLNTADKLEEDQSGTASLQIIVTDENDNSPIFKQPQYITDIPIGKEIQEVVEVVAIDADEGSNAELSYEIISQTGGDYNKIVDYFVIDDESEGKISTSSKKTMFTSNDYDKYNLTVIAKDKGKISNSGSTLVSIYLRKTDEIVEITVDADYNDLLADSGNLMNDLADLLGYKTCFSDIEEIEDSTYNLEYSENVISVYCLNYNDTVVPREELNSEISKKEKEVYDLFLSDPYGYTILSINVPNTGSSIASNTLNYLLFGICIVAFVVVILLILINFQTRRRYKRLKAATDPEHDQATLQTDDDDDDDGNNVVDAGIQPSIPLTGKNVRNNPLYGVDTVPNDNNHDYDSIDENEVNAETESAQNSYTDEFNETVILGLPGATEEVFDDNNYLLLAALDEHEQESRKEQLQKQKQENPHQYTNQDAVEITEV